LASARISISSSLERKKNLEQMICMGSCGQCVGKELHN
jgi:hypothetical protein